MTGRKVTASLPSETLSDYLLFFATLLLATVDALTNFYSYYGCFKDLTKIEIDTRHCEPPVASDSVAIWGEAVSNKALLKNKVEIASHPSDARNDRKKYLIFKWLYQLLDFYLYFWDLTKICNFMI
ncbi:hypothetical protein JCM13991_20210 [Thermodesulfovibrio hydrogeniphilus]